MHSPSVWKLLRAGAAGLVRAPRFPGWAVSPASQLESFSATHCVCTGWRLDLSVPRSLAQWGHDPGNHPRGFEGNKPW